MNIDDMIEMKEEGEACAVCGKHLDRGGFARISHRGEMVPVCCPLCMETFQKDPGPYAAKARTRRLLKTSPPTPPARSSG
jgi:hypothetical protein